MRATGLKKDKSGLTQTSTQRTKCQTALEETLQENIPALRGQSLGGMTDRRVCHEPDNKLGGASLEQVRESVTSGWP